MWTIKFHKCGKDINTEGITIDKFGCFAPLEFYDHFIQNLIENEKECIFQFLDGITLILNQNEKKLGTLDSKVV